MAQVFMMPQLGSTMEEGLIVRWCRTEGEVVKKGDVLLEIETDKATVEVESPVDGVVLKILASVESSIPVQKPIAVLGAIGEDVSHLLTGMAVSPPHHMDVAGSDVQGPQEPVDQGAAAGVGSVETLSYLSPRARKLAESRQVQFVALAGRGTGPGGRILERDVVAYLGAESAESGYQASHEKHGARLTPLAARIADDLGVDKDDLALGLPGSRVRSEDVLRHVQTARADAKTEYSTDVAVAQPALHVSEAADYSVTPFAGIRRRIADNVTKSAFTAPHVTLTLEVDMTACTMLRTQLLARVEQRFGVRLSYTDILVKVVACALNEHPKVNSVLVGDEIRTYGSKNIGIAVALDEGLVVPVVKHAETKSLGRISAELKPLVERARSGKVTPDDVSGGTFSITNLGTFGIDLFDPILVTGQAAILGVGRIAEKPVVVAGQIAIRSMMNLCLSFDHRILDGAPAARYLQRIKELMENPVELLL